MSSNPESSRSQGTSTTFSKHRIEALSDGVFAIAMTLLVLDIKVPTDVPAGQLGHAIALQSHEWVSFVITFSLASIFWAFQHRVFELLDDVKRHSLPLTFVFLALVSLLPFTTSVWGHHITEPLAFRFYFLDPCLMALMLALKLELARRGGHVRINRTSETLQFRLWVVFALMGISALGTVVLPRQYIGLAPLPLIPVARWMRGRFKRKWDRIEAEKDALMAAQAELHLS